jgi:creatinine deaminase
MARVPRRLLGWRKSAFAEIKAWFAPLADIHQHVAKLHAGGAASRHIETLDHCDGLVQVPNAPSTSGKTAMPATLSDTDRNFLRLAYEEALAGYNEGGCPIGSVLAEGERLVSQGRNQRVQKGDPIAHGEMDALRKAGRQKSYSGMTLYTSLSPCMMCAGTIIQFAIPRIVIGENVNFGGNEDFLRSRGVQVIVADDRDCIALMRRFISEKPELWAEDIAED